VKYKLLEIPGNPLDDLDLDRPDREAVGSAPVDAASTRRFNACTATRKTTAACKALHDAIMDALFHGGVLPEETLERLMADPADAARRTRARCSKNSFRTSSDRMMEEGFINTGRRIWSRERASRARHRRRHGPDAPPKPLRSDRQEPGLPRIPRPARFCWARLARAAWAGTTRAITPPASENRRAPKPYEFGDSLNLDRAAPCSTP